MLTEKELQAIEARADVAMREGWAYQLDESVRDIPALLVEVRRLRAERLSGTCTWKYDDMLDVYETDCEATMWYSDGTPAQNGAVFCSQCGRRIVVEMPGYEEDDDAEEVD